MLWRCCPSSFSSVALAPDFLAGRRDFAVEQWIDRNREQEELCCGTCCLPPCPSWLNMTPTSRPGRFCTVIHPYLKTVKGCCSCPSSPAGGFSDRDPPWPRFVTSASPNSDPPGIFCKNPHSAGGRPAFVAEEGGSNAACTGSTPVWKASRAGGGLGTLRQPLSR